MFKSNVLLETLYRTYNLLNRKQKQRASLNLGLLFFNSILELVGLAAILPVITILLQKEAIETNQFLREFYLFLGLNSPKAFLILLALAVLILISIKNILALWIVKFQSRFVYSLYTHFSCRLFQHYYTSGLKYFKNTNPNSTVRDINNIPLDFVNYVVVNLLALINEVLITLLIFLCLLLYDYKIVALLIIFILPIVGFFYRSIKNKANNLQVELNHVLTDLNKNTFQGIYGYIDVKMNNAEMSLFNSHLKLLYKNTSLRVQDRILQSAPTKILETGMTAAIVIMALYGVLYVQDSTHVTGLITLFALAAYRILPSINRILIALIGIKGFQYTFKVIENLPNKETLLRQSLPESDISFDHEISFKNVCFSYADNTSVLKDINISIGKGQSLGIFGRSGSGKSTLINILLGFYQPDTGHVCVDNIPLDKNNINSWRKKIGYVQQETYIVDATLAENIAFGIEPDLIDHEKVANALSLARLDEVVKKLPQGVSTRIGDRGVLLSGGQKQRVGIARALYSGASILVLDEATSSQDKETESEIIQTVNFLQDKKITLIIISHRLSNIQSCDKIIELYNGRIRNAKSVNDLVSGSSG